MLHLGDIKYGGKFQVNNRRYFTMLHMASRSQKKKKKGDLHWLKKQLYKLIEEDYLRAIKFKEATMCSVSSWAQTFGSWDTSPNEYPYILCLTF